MSKYSVTYNQYRAFVNSGEYDNLAWWQDFPKVYQAPPVLEQGYQYGNHPCTNITWYQAVAFTRWLNSSYLELGLELISDSKEAELLRLPLEQEWEYAARGAESEQQYPYGNEFDVSKCNTSETNIATTTTVGCFPDGASPFQVLDMSGNVWEWCASDYTENSGRKVLRGGSFYGDAFSATCASRHGLEPSYSNHFRGFRVVMVATVIAIP
jgi:formylglycine-generating enzyme required for sulfatase activity